MRHQHNIDVNIGPISASERLPSCGGQNCRVQQGIEMEDLAMTLIRNGYAVSTRRGILGALLSAFMALALCYPGAATAHKWSRCGDQADQARRQAYSGLYRRRQGHGEDLRGANPEKPDPKLDAQAEAVAKKNGFASLDEFEGVSTNISMIMSGIDPQTKKFTEPPEQIRKEIAALKADKSVPEAEKKQGWRSSRRDQGRKAHSVQGKHRAGLKVLRQAFAAHAKLTRA